MFDYIITNLSSRGKNNKICYHMCVKENELESRVTHILDVRNALKFRRKT
jgi:hypothetical protein